MHVSPSRLIALSMTLFAAIPARADDSQLPRRAPGLWEMTATWRAYDQAGTEIDDAGGPARDEFSNTVKQYCFDTATEAEEMSLTFTPTMRGCSALRSREGDAFVFQSDCVREDASAERTRTILKMRGNFARGYLTTILMETWSGETSAAPVVAGATTAARYVKRTGDLQARRIAERCPEGLMPGDIVLLPDGVRTTVSDLRRAAEDMRR